ncbi:MAG: hypothetical protein JNM63_04885, partial [Spirochaetia bacterium]|nr:hypothetical protein [Spirochaetia bacterium]
MSTKSHIGGVIAVPFGENSSGWCDLDMNFSVITEGAYEGRQAMRVRVGEIRSGKAQMWIPHLNLEKGGYLKLSFAVRNPQSGSLNIALRQAGSPWKTYWSQNISVSPEWNRQTIVIPATVDDPKAVMLFTFDSGDWDFDDFSFVRISTGQLAAEAIPRVGNLLATSSFPLGLSGGWHLTHGSYSVPGDGTGSAEGDAKEPGPTGVPSLKVSPPNKMPTKISFNLCSPPFKANIEKNYTVSFYAKAESEGKILKVKIGPPDAGISFGLKPTTDWQRLTLKTKLPYSASGYQMMRLTSDVTCWFDGMMIEEAENIGEFVRSFPLELSLKAVKPFGLTIDNQPFEINLHVAGSITEGSKLVGQLVDLAGQSTSVGPIAVSANTTQPLSLSPAALPYGTFRLEARVVSAAGEAKSAFKEVLLHRVHSARMMGSDAPLSPFGIHIVAEESAAKMAKTLGFNWIRCHDGSGELTKWFFLEDEKGHWDFSDADQKIDMMRKNHLMILGSLDTSPGRYSGVGTSLSKGNFYYKYHIPKPDSMEAWSNYCFRVVDRYKTKINTWEVWNEPYVKNFFRLTSGSNGSLVPGTPENYVTLLKSAYQAIKKADDKATVIWSSAGFNYLDGAWHQGCVEQGAYRHADVVSYHLY